MCIRDRLYPVDNDFTYTGNGGVSCNLPGTMLIWGKLDQTNGVDYATGQAIRNNHLATQNCAATTSNTTPAPCVAYDQCTRPVEWCAIDGLAHALWPQAASAFWRYFAEDGVATPETPLFVDGFESGSAPPVSPRWVMGYHVGYERNLLPTANIDFPSLTHLMVGRLIPNANATLTATKGSYVRAQGLGGTIIWTIAQGYRPDCLSPIRHSCCGQ